MAFHISGIASSSLWIHEESKHKFKFLRSGTPCSFFLAGTGNLTSDTYSCLLDHFKRNWPYGSE
jgi:hypothetical protein